MKKYLILASAALVALAACNKEQQEIVEPVNQNEEVVLTFTSQRPQLDVDTKTAWNEATSSIVWTTNDKIRVGYTLDRKWMSADGPADFSANPKVSAKFYISNKVSIDATETQLGTFSVPTDYTNSPSGTAVFYGLYPSTATGLDSNYAPSLSVSIPLTQTPGVNTFDSAADVMVGKSDNIPLSGSFPAEAIALNWSRLVAHADLTFAGLAVEGEETVSKITLTFNTEAKVAGSFNVDVTDGTVTTNSGTKNEIVLLGNNLSISSGSIEAWCCLLPVTFSSLDVTIKTNKATYTRSIIGISKTFKQNARNTLTINMASAHREENTQVVDDGNYVIAALNSDTYYAISSANNANSSRRDRVALASDFDPSNYTVSSPYTATNSIIWTITNVSGGVTINLAGDTSKYMKYGSSTLPLGTDATTFEISESNGTYIFEASSKYISMNGSYGFACYANSSELYLIPAAGTPSMTFATTAKTVSAETTSVVFDYTSLFLSDVPSVSVTTDEGNAVVSTSVDNTQKKVTVTLSANSTTDDKTIELTVSATGVTPVTLTITQKGVVAPATAGDVLWSEDFSDVSVTSGGSTTGNSSCNTDNVYGGAVVSYTYSDNGSNKTLVYGENSAGGTKPELLIGKKANASATVWGIFTASGIPTSGFGVLTLNYVANGSITFSSSTSGVTFGGISSNGNSRSVVITNANTADYIEISFENPTTTNVRVDDIELVAGGPTPGITVTTDDASATSTEAGTTATLNGTLSLENGATNANVTSAGFYYKLSSASGYTKVTCESAPTTTTSFSYNLTGLTKDSQYTYYAWAKYDNGSEVTGAETAKTFTPTQGGEDPTVYTIQWGSSYNSASIQDYTSSWTATKDGFTVNMANFNNNQNGWDYVKCGRKNNASTATIITNSKISEAIKTVTITIDALTVANITSITLYVSDSKTSGWASAGTFTKATGNQSVTISSPAANKYYKLEFVCTSGSSNGLLTLSKAQFSTN